MFPRKKENSVIVVAVIVSVVLMSLNGLGMHYIIFAFKKYKIVFLLSLLLSLLLFLQFFGRVWMGWNA